ncbi:hypothetical protein [Falsiroseomonas oryziterrae]|uniref:hypothetical protein n=1 Tax=Falsiroseomonas oryziterrae TaxID=2911368 RepID=UPI001F3529AB|nr:hypothetical protein [Roseomonas sp. NPKOSM-4]
MKDIPSPFASPSVGRHLLRGLVGFPAMFAAVPLWFLGQAWWHGAAALVLGVVAVVAFRGCFLCWTLGLVQTALQGRRDHAALRQVNRAGCAACEPAAR